jgi:uncharacterized membrane protein
MGRLARIARHRWLDERHVRRALDASALARLQARLAASEAHHSGEIRVCVEAGLPLPYLWRSALPRQRAVDLFGELGVWDTEANNGVLIYLLLAERAIEIVADRAVARLVPQAHWTEVLQGMRTAFNAGRFEDGLAGAIDAVDAALARLFPLAPGQANPNQLPDHVDIR